MAKVNNSYLPYLGSDIFYICIWGGCVVIVSSRHNVHIYIFIILKKSDFTMNFGFLSIPVCKSVRNDRSVILVYKNAERNG